MDLSKQYLDEVVLEALSEWVSERGVAQAVQALFEGQPLNLTEGRAVLHMALRADASDVFEVDGQSVVSDVMKERERCLAFAESVRSGAHTGHTGQAIERVINIGIGGSDLGPRMAVQALARIMTVGCSICSQCGPSGFAIGASGSES